MATSPPIQPQIDTILVPQGIEFRKVSRGLWATGQTQCRVVSIPLGSQGLTRFLDQWLGAQEQKNYPQNVVLMGLCGSLSPEIQGGNVVIYQGCTGRIGHRSDFVQRCNPELTDCIEQKLHAVAVVKTIQRVQGFTSDRVISSAQEKQQIHQIYQADVVDMEGFIVLEHLNS
ncbi:MAG: 5'-methylthioadenosine/S-adenosylhomocysteine nucleosidase, partial [Oscillatoriales cyanobacterium RM1_1_9]|nr:5'-methylthioadenosine/S-adenosylhomocysteine nucleosidase [Oscillatoriales cyanobacterium RM1_1_9]